MSFSPVRAAGELHGSKSADDLLRLYFPMGIPHFQRGLVWDTGAVGMLLESIFHDTPCGSIILWAPPEAAVHGILLGDCEQAPAQILIVDGQQRIRSPHTVFGAEDDDGSPRT